MKHREIRLDHDSRVRDVDEETHTRSEFADARRDHAAQPHASHFAAVASAALFLTSAVLAGNALVPSTLTVDESTFHAIGFRYIVDGDDDKDATLTVSWRRLGDVSWQQGPAGLRINGEPAGINGWISGNLFAGSVLDLTPGASYEVRLELADPDGITGPASQTITASTRAVPVKIAGLHLLHVYTSCSGTGKLQPCYTDLVSAATATVPGDVVLIHAGTYAWMTRIDLSFLSSRATSETLPIVFRGEDRDTVILDHGVAPRGSTQEMFGLVGTKYLRFESFTVKNAGTVFYARDAVGLVVNRVKLESVYAGVGGADSPKGKDRGWWIADNDMVGWNTQWYPYSSPGTSISGIGIRVYGKGHVVEYNRVGKFWDCIAHSDTGGGQVTNALVDWRNPPSVNMDLNNNDLYECFDDALSADYGFHNLRILENRITNSHTAISIQPVYGGPTYVLRNAAFNMAANSFKLHNQAVGTEAYHNTFAVHDIAWQCDAGWLNARIRNNLMLGNPSTASYSVATGTPRGDARNAIDYNGYSASTGSNLVRWNRAAYGAAASYARYRDLAAFYAGEGFEQHGRIVDYSMFDNAWFPAGEGTTYRQDEARLTLRPAALAVDAGVPIPGINAGWRGSAPDLGAFEYGASLPTYGPRPLLPGEASDPLGAGALLKIVRRGTQYDLSWSAPLDGATPERYKLYSTPLALGFTASCEADLGTGVSATLGSLTANRGFVVVARTSAGEGPYGWASNGVERPHATVACP